MLDWGILILKYAGMVVSCGFGVYGLKREFKDKDGRVTKAGRRALIGIIVGTVVAVTTETLEHIKKHVDEVDERSRRESETLNAVRRTEVVINEISRGLHPIAPLRLNYRVNIASDNNYIKDYASRIAKAIPSIEKQMKRPDRATVPGVEGGGFTSGFLGQQLSSVSIAEGELAPNEASESVASGVLRDSDIFLSFFRNPIEPKKVLGLDGVESRPEPDLELQVATHFNTPGRQHEHAIAYDVSTGRLALNIIGFEADQRYWRSNGAIVGIPDLLGTQLFVEIASMAYTGKPGSEQVIDDVRRKTELSFITLHMPGGRTFRLKSEDFTQYRNRDGFPVYEIVFPKTLEELEELAY